MVSFVFHGMSTPPGLVPLLRETIAFISPDHKAGYSGGGGGYVAWGQGRLTCHKFFVEI